MAGEEAVEEEERHQERRPEAVAESKNNWLQILITITSRIKPLYDNKRISWVTNNADFLCN